MKKALLLLAAVLTTMAASAQFEIGLGGSFSIPGYSTKIGDSKNLKDSKSERSYFNIMPTVGFRLNDAMSLGAFFDYSSQKNHRYEKGGGTSADPVQKDNQSNLSMYGGGLFFRYNVVSYGDIRIFFELQGLFSVGGDESGLDNNGEWTVNEKRDIMAMRFGIVPGASYQITDYISFDVYFNFASLGYSMMKYTTTGEMDKSDPMNPTYVTPPADKQKEDAFSMFGFNNMNDYINPVNNYNLGSVIGLKLNVTF